MCAAAWVFSKSSVMIIIALMIGCTWISNDVYEKAYDYHRKGKIALARRDYPEAQMNLEQALQIWPSQMPDSSDKAAVHNNLGWALEAQKEPEKAIQNFEIGRTLFRKDVSCSHPFLAVLLNNYCDSRMSLNDWAGAQDTCFAAFTANTTRPPDKILSDVPPEDIAWGLFNWGVAWAQVSNGESYYIPISKILEPDQPVSAPVKIELDPVGISDVYFQLGRLSLQRDDYKDSERFHQRAFDIRDEKLGTIHESTADSKAALGQVKLCQSRIQDAENDERQALGVR